MLTQDWKRQRRRVERWQAFAEAKVAQERRMRHSVKVRSLDLLARTETMVLISATGAVWMGRLKDIDDPEERQPVVELVHSGFIVHRWKRLARRVARKWLKK